MVRRASGRPGNLIRLGPLVYDPGGRVPSWLNEVPVDSVAHREAGTVNAFVVEQAG